MRRSIAVAVLITVCAAPAAAGCSRPTPASPPDLRGEWRMTSFQDVFHHAPREVTLDVSDSRPVDEGAAFQSNVAGCPARWSKTYAVVDGHLKLGERAPMPAIGCLGDVTVQTHELSRFLDLGPDARVDVGAAELILNHGKQRLVLQRVQR